jgi:hypothetical protein
VIGVAATGQSDFTVAGPLNSIFQGTLNVIVLRL